MPSEPVGLAASVRPCADAARPVPSSPYWAGAGERAEYVAVAQDKPATGRNGELGREEEAAVPEPRPTLNGLPARAGLVVMATVEHRASAREDRRSPRQATTTRLDVVHVVVPVISRQLIAGNREPALSLPHPPRPQS